MISEKAETPVFRGTGALARGLLRSKGGGKTSIHYNGDSATAELLFRIIISVSQLSVCGAVSDWCGELAQQISDHSSSSTGRTVAVLDDGSESQVSPNVVSILTNPPSINVAVQGDRLRRHNKRFGHVPEDSRVSKAGEHAGIMRKISGGQYFMTIHDVKSNGFEYAGSRREKTSPRSDERSRKLAQDWKSRLRIT